MELKEIKDIRVGQIWQSQNNDFIFSVVIKKIKDTYFECDMFGNETWCRENSRLNKENLINKLECKLISFLNITHKIEDNKLVEIERKEFEVGDIVMFSGNENPLLIIYNSTEKRYRKGDLEIIKFYRLFNGIDYADAESERIIKKIGVYGITHEFINKNLTKE